MEIINGLHENYVEAAINFQESLNFTRYGKRAFLNEFYQNQIRYENNKINSQLQHEYLRPIIVEFPKKNELVPNQEEIERKKQIRKEQGERLKEAILKKREQKMKVFEQELKDLEELQRSQQHDKETFESQLRSLGMQKMDQLQKKVRDLKIKLGHIKKEDIEQEKTNLLNIPNDQLTPDQQRLKKIQQFHKQAQEIRQLKKEQDLQKKQEIQALKDSDPTKYMNALYEKREKYIQKLEQKKKQRQELGVRNSKANQRRMQTLAQLGGEQPKLKKGLEKEDTFGMNDEDWNLYRGLSVNDISDDESTELKLQELDNELRELDDDFDQKIQKNNYLPTYLEIFDNQIRLGVERYRGPEAFFQPSIVGIDQAGLIEVMLFVIRKYPLEIQQKLLKNILLSGGGSLTKNIEKRIHNDLLANFDIGTEINIYKSRDPIQGPWQGMKLYTQNFNINEFCITKEEYQEKGSTYFKPNPFSNLIVQII